MTTMYYDILQSSIVIRSLKKGVKKDMCKNLCRIRSRLAWASNPYSTNCSMCFKPGSSWMCEDMLSMWVQVCTSEGRTYEARLNADWSLSAFTSKGERFVRKLLPKYCSKSYKNPKRIYRTRASFERCLD